MTTTDTPNDAGAIATEDEVKQVVKSLRPYLQSHGGDLEYVGMDSERGIVRVRLKGMCGGCPHAGETLRHVVEAEIRRLVPSITGVIAG